MLRSRLVEIIAQNQHLSRNEKIILDYGLKKVFGIVSDTFFTLLLGLLLGITLEAVTYQLAFMVLRAYAGGYHAKTEYACKIQSLLTTICSILFIRILVYLQWFDLNLNFVFSIYIAVFSPIESINKPLSKKERQISHWKTIGILSVLNISIILTYVRDTNEMYALIVAIISTGFLMCL